MEKEKIWDVLRKRTDSRRRAAGKAEATDVEMRGYLLGREEAFAAVLKDMKGLENGTIPLTETRTQYYERLEEERRVSR